MQSKACQKARIVLENTQKSITNLQKNVDVLVKASDLIKKQGGCVFVTGIGKSGFVGQKISATLTSLGQMSHFLHPVEAIHGDIGVLSPNDTILALSFSGESNEVVKVVRYAKKNFKVPIISFTRSSSSSLGKISDVCVGIKIPKEGSPNDLAPMASTTSMLVLGDMLAAILSDKGVESFARNHPGGSLGLKLKKVSEFMSPSIPTVRSSDDFQTLLKEISQKKMGITGVLGSQNNLMGVITDGDIRRFFLKNKKTDGVQAFDLMTKSPKFIKEDKSLLEALSKMEKYKITQLFIVDKKKKPVGIIHIHNILNIDFS